ncbi:PepSY domain-containing protein [Sphingomonas sp. QA11]|uniref:PepSY domain-containing protein n=1 Tax=Sphingomonas sp. QA11 TaxID=2950605 RepID=UPI00234BCED7|nr:PepSY domain-containing protein [Sphingomonas sp. QA11]WCM25832.1 PepSY domain-containing protein [Sphingomonas sp. QA11]
MKRLRLSPLLFRRIHKWVGLALGLQFVLWTLSGAIMALLPADSVGGHGGGGGHGHALAAGPYIDPARLSAGQPISGLVLRDLGGRPVYEIREASGIRLADATTGAPVNIDRATAIAVAEMTSNAPVASVEALARPNLESREHKGAMWRVNLDDPEHSSAYVSAVTGRHLVTRGDSWRTWDFFWMLHNMDYANRASFNHPLIIVVAFGVLWLSGTGFYLLFKSFRKTDFKWLRRRRRPAQG